MRGCYLLVHPGPSYPTSHTQLGPSLVFTQWLCGRQNPDPIVAHPFGTTRALVFSHKREIQQSDRADSERYRYD